MRCSVDAQLDSAHALRWRKDFIKKGLTKTIADMKKCANERIIPRVKIAQDNGLYKLSLGLKYILAKLATRTNDEMITRESTYDGWYQRLRSENVLDLANERGITVDQFVLCLGLGWNADVIRGEYGFEEKEMIQIS